MVSSASSVTNSTILQSSAEVLPTKLMLLNRLNGVNTSDSDGGESLFIDAIKNDTEISNNDCYTTLPVEGTPINSKLTLDHK